MQNKQRFSRRLMGVLAACTVLVGALSACQRQSDRETSETAAQSVHSTFGQEVQAADSIAETADAASVAGDSAAEAPVQSTPTPAFLPEVQESEGLSLSSVYTSTIINPDAEDAVGEDVASLEVANQSERYLLAATLTAKLSDGTELQFQVSELPAGAVAEIFDVENRSVPAGVSCESVVCTAEEYLDDAAMPETIEVTMDDTGAVLTNTGDSTLENLTVVYHCDMAGQFFGGTAYTYIIESLPAGESFTLTDDGLMGEIEIVRVY